MASNGNKDPRKSPTISSLGNPWLNRLALMMGLSLWLGGCILLPLPASEKLLAGKPVTEAQLAFLVPKATMKQEVVERLGSPNFVWEDARLFGYNWEMRQGMLIWFIGAAAGGAGGVANILEFHLFLIQFDADDRALRWEAVVRPSSQSFPDFLREWVNKSPATAADRSSGAPQ